MPTRKLQFTFFPFIYVILVALALVLALPVHAVTTSNDVTLRVSGSTNRTVTMLSGSTYDTLTVQSGGFEFTLSGSESVTLRSSSKDTMSNTFAVAVTCGDSSSDLVLSASKGSTAGVTLDGTACSRGGGGGSGSSGGGSSSSSSSTSGSTTTTTASSAGTTATTQTTTAPAAPPSAPAAQAATPSTPAAPSSASSMSLSRPLKAGSKGEEVVALQKFLQAKGFIPSTVKLTGYYGPATTKAVKLFQAKHKLAQVGQVGPMTLKALNAEMSGMPSGSTPTPPPPSPASASSATGTTAADIQKQITDLTALINSLNAQIKARQQ